MATHREANNPTYSYVEPMPWPKDVPKVDEVGATSAPLKSIAFFFGQFCQPYAEDFMLCKNENRDPEHCLKEGRRVTRCAQDLCVYMYKLTAGSRKSARNAVTSGTRTGSVSKRTIKYVCTLTHTPTPTPTFSLFLTQSLGIYALSFIRAPTQQVCA